MKDIDVLNYVLEHGALDEKTLDAFVDMAAKLISGEAQALNPRQRAWTDAEYTKTRAQRRPKMPGSPEPRRAMWKRGDFTADKPVDVVNCGPLPKFPPGMAEGTRRFGGPR
jgi:hypothetical protein